MRRIPYLLAAIASCCYGAAVTFPTSPLSIPVTSSSGTSFTFTGTLTQNDTISFTQTGLVCIQGGGTYCTNGAGVVVTPGTLGPGGTFSTTATVAGFTKTFVVGSLMLAIQGVNAVQVFPATPANGAGSATPPTSLTLPPTTFAALGFPNFTVVNPTITLVVFDNLYPDNSGSTQLQQQAVPPAVPAPSALLLVGIGLAAVSLAVPWIRRHGVNRPVITRGM